jgi:multisubunit Na+/H+ antiporter MnhC subunit
MLMMDVTVQTAMRQKIALGLMALGTMVFLATFSVSGLHGGPPSLLEHSLETVAIWFVERMVYPLVGVAIFSYGLRLSGSRSESRGAY